MTMFILSVNSKVLIYVRCNWHVPGLDTTAVPDTTQKGDICSVKHCEDIKNLLQESSVITVVIWYYPVVRKWRWKVLLSVVTLPHLRTSPLTVPMVMTAVLLSRSISSRKTWTNCHKICHHLLISLA